MKVTMLMVMSVNGKITDLHSPDIYTWTSAEDKEHFFSRIVAAQLIVMGRKTYDTAKHLMKHRAGKLRVIMTGNPQQFVNEEVSGQLVFTDKSAREIVQYYSSKGYTEILLVGGAMTNGAFLQAGLVDEVYLTIEPLLIAEGEPFLQALQKNQRLTLQHVEKLNNQGTLLCHYSLQHS